MLDYERTCQATFNTLCKSFVPYVGPEKIILPLRNSKGQTANLANRGEVGRGRP